MSANRWIALVCLVPLLAFGQARRMMMQPMLSVPGVSSNFWATNYGTPIASWIADNAVYIPSSSNICTNLPDVWVNGYNLTNPVVSKAPQTLTNSLNGHHTLLFDGVDDFLRCVNFTNQNPAEYWIVGKFSQGTNGVNAYWFSGNSTTVAHRFYKPASDKFLMFSGSNVLTDNPIDTLTNRWLVFCVSLGPVGGMFTNTVLLKAGNTGITNCSGLHLGSGDARQDNGRIEVAEFAAYGIVSGSAGTNSTATRSLIYSGFTNKYGVANFQ